MGGAFPDKNACQDRCCDEPECACLQLNKRVMKILGFNGLLKTWQLQKYVGNTLVWMHLLTVGRLEERLS